jgi:hypothetical protein
MAFVSGNSNVNDNNTDYGGDTPDFNDYYYDNDSNDYCYVNNPNNNINKD